ncbi:probable RNA polymerase ECF-type sigma factor [Plesiocystis pacifica SIR-1]|uniref:Probable RNA polymerase ECF-type sigma factor n=1 Tax=Plesiocystis pacifica SIR-1 TaxID=391625 RepID=A6G3G9_9BACT|nr:RNA polymerase sigma factor [Plesiocystis pacifica]EDM79576.1 probable RNA polymerase ECF-type sigma factor [Plesiocystis pacifica SIR-1]
MNDLQRWPIAAGPKTLRQLNAELVTYLCRKIGSRDIAEDLAQDAWLACPSYRGESSLRTFLRAVARRQIAEWYRTTRPRRARQHFVSKSLPDPATTLSSRLEHADEIARLRRWLSQLPEPFQSTVRLWLTGMSNKAIAQALGCSENTVRSRVSRARTMMRTRLEREDQTLANPV